MKKIVAILLCLFLQYQYSLSQHVLRSPFFLITHTDQELPISLDKIAALKHVYPCLYDRFQINDQLLSVEEKTLHRSKLLFDHGAVKVSLTTQCNKIISGYFFDRGKNTVLVTGPGLWKNAESISHFADWFQDYDLFILDPRWSDTNNFLYNIFKTPTKDGILKQVLKLMNIQFEDITAVLKWLTSYKNYEQKIAKGICYSSWMFITAQHKYQTCNPELMFDKLILSSCGLSLESFIDNIISNHKEALGMAPDAIHPGFIKKLLDTDIVIVNLLKLAKMFTPDFSITDYLCKIKHTPILFMHGTSDQLITFEDRFKTLWQAASISDKAAFITPFAHAENDKNAELYKKVVDTFIASTTTDEFITRIIS